MNSNSCSGKATRPKSRPWFQPPPARGQPSYQNLRAVYFDTPHCDLWKHGFTLRVRANGKSHIQTVKRNAPPASCATNGKRKLASSSPIWTSSEIRPSARLAAKSSIRNALRPAFEVNVERTSYGLEADGSVIDVAIDQGAIEANGDQLGVRELELELKSGDRRAFFNLARAFVLASAASSKPYQQSRARLSSRRRRLGPLCERF